MEVVYRKEWGAVEPKDKSWIKTPVKYNYLHHTASNSKYYHGAGGMRQIQRDHMYGRGWYDIGYSWVYDPWNKTWYEARGFGVSGAHTEGYNQVAHGFCIMGNFQTADVDATDLKNIARFVGDAHKAGHGPAEFTGGHRDVGSTTCPGDHLYKRISQINTLIKEHLEGGSNMPERYDETTDPRFQDAYNWMVDKGVFSDWTEPEDALTAEKFAVFFRRAVEKGVFKD